jgi:hypothetical protein
MEQKTKHTPGPWIVHTFTISGKEKLEVLDATGTNACVQANAHLIAAAPAMYEALQQTLFLVELAALEEWGREVTGEHQPPTTEARDRLEKVKAALAQAEGK